MYVPANAPYSPYVGVIGHPGTLTTHDLHAPEDALGVQFSVAFVELYPFLDLKCPGHAIWGDTPFFKQSWNNFFLLVHER